MELQSVCERLDSLCLEELQLMEEYIECMLQLEDATKIGYINMAKARYIMGNNSVSSLQLPSEDSPNVAALCTVDLQVDTRPDGEKVQFQMNRSDSESGKECATTGDERTGTRKRVLNENVGQTLIEKGGNNAARTISDPIRWFGVLVPNSLRQAQMNFQSALPLVVKCVNLKIRLHEVNTSRQNQLKKKSDLKVNKP